MIHHPIGYQVYADYTFNSVDRKIISGKISDRLNLLLHNNMHTLKITYIGTSISLGADTYEHFYHGNPSQAYPFLLAKALKKVYGVDIELINKSIDGGGVNQIQNIDSVLMEEPNIVIMELGMNDHIHRDPSYLEYFKQSIEAVIDECKEREIEIILVGFFQQNSKWELAYPENMLKYNDILKEIAITNNLYFADIYDAFKNFSHEKISRDLMGDYIHHPTSFGHQLYYLEIMPCFIKGEIDKYALLQYIY